MPITSTSRKDRSQSTTGQLANLCQDGYFSFSDKNNAKLLLKKWLVLKENDLYEAAGFVPKVTVQNSWVPVLRSPRCTTQRTPADVCRGCCHKADPTINIIVGKQDLQRLEIVLCFIGWFTLEFLLWEPWLEKSPCTSLTFQGVKK